MKGARAYHAALALAAPICSYGLFAKLKVIRSTAHENVDLQADPGRT
jgi:hypothetical protein